MKKTIECKNIKKSFSNGSKTFEILHDINMVTYEQQMVMLMGPSGSGKTTLLSIIGGILDQDSGECLVMDTPINTLAGPQKTTFRGNTIGFLFQHVTLIPQLNAIENAAIPLLCTGTNQEAAFAKAIPLLETVGLKDQIYKDPDHLSGGEQQRVAIVRSVIHEPKIILCDEPTSYLDSERGAQIMQILEDIKNKHKCTIIVVTHDYRILKFADKILEIEDGRITERKNNHSYVEEK